MLRQNAELLAVALSKSCLEASHPFVSLLLYKQMIACPHSLLETGVQIACAECCASL